MKPVDSLIKGSRALLLAALVCADSGAQAVEGDAACVDRSEERHAYFGDLHIHTGRSADAMLFGTVNRPADAYRFARGEEILIRQTSPGAVPRPGRISRPLDFAAVTDHAENIGAVSLCLTPGSEAYDSAGCQLVREPLAQDNMDTFAAKLGKKFQAMYVDEEICGKDRARCRAAVAAPWNEIQQSAHEANSPCDFTAFVGYEYSPTPDGSKLHHNVVFRGAEVMDVPISSSDVPSMIDLWRRLKAECKDAGTGCDVIAIPHNSNLGNGQMFSLAYDGEKDPARQKEIALLRSEIEPVVESFQEKGDSDCRNGLWNVLGGSDELCNFEKYRDWRGAKFEDCRDGQGSGALQGRGCVSRLDYTRYALAAGLSEERRIGANPHKFGVIGSTDNHKGTTADVDEWLHDGVKRELSPMEPGRMSTGGIAGVWAEENTRASLFDAFQRREVFSTSGTRIRVRMFGGWDLPADLCGKPDLVQRAYAEGVPMGGDLVARASEPGPSFVVTALADAGTAAHPGTPLQRAQIIKVWAGEGDELHQAVFDVAGGPSDASVDVATCERSGAGAMSLCGMWRDPDYDPTIRAAYYARVIENPSCRYPAYACLAAADAAEPAFCEDGSVVLEVQDRAWGSPIWITPRD